MVDFTRGNSQLINIRFLALAGWISAQAMAGLAFGQVLTHGPVVGGVTDSGANIFVRTDQAASVAIRYGTDPNFANYLTSDAFDTDSSSDFTKIIQLAGLTAETTYYLDVVVNDVPQLTAPYPSFRTFPPIGSSRDFTFLALSDFTTVRTLTGPSQTFASAAAVNPVFAFIGGDFDHRNPHRLAEKRQMFKDLYDPNMPYMGDFVNLILRKMPISHQWDDHDSGSNNIDRTYPDWSLTQQAFQEYIPSYALPSVTPGIWQKLSYAQADLFVLDCRSQRDPEDDPDGPDKSMLDGNSLGATGQLQWLENGLLGSIARWKVIFTSVVTNPTTKFPDGWAGYDTEWNALKDFINSNNIQGIVFISGDLHIGAIDNGTASGFPEMCVSQANGAGSCPTDRPGVWSEGFYQDKSCKGFNLVTVSTNPDRLTLQVLDELGNTRITYTLGDGIPTPTPTPTPTPAPPVITKQPKNKVAKLGQTAKFTVMATGTLPLSFQWQKNGADIPGATTPIYNTPPTTLDDNGATFDVVVTNNVGTVTSTGALLIVRVRSASSSEPPDPVQPIRRPNSIAMAP